MINQSYLTAKNKRLSKPSGFSNQIAQKYKLPLFLAILHIPLGVLLYSSSALALIHPWATFSLGLYYAVRKNEKLERVAYVLSYIIGAEVLWRMAESSIFWEFGKYGAAVIMAVALIQRGHLRFPIFPLLYFIFLIPACFLTFFLNEVGDARDKLSSNMSGPLLLLISCWFFSHLKVNVSQLKKILSLISVPLVSVGVSTFFFTVTNDDIVFTNDSNFSTSGGFGPNQVSSMLGLGVFVCSACYLLFKNDLKDTIYLGILCVFFAAQSMLTFSRGGMYSAVGAILAVIIVRMRNFDQGIKRLLPAAGIGLLFLLLVFPYLDNFTGGKLQERFENTGTSNRTELIESDLELFMENPFLGTGVGEAKFARARISEVRLASHTEFSRLVSEHGTLGILSLFALAFVTFYNYRRHNSNMGKALALGAIIWTSLFMLNAGMRMAAPAFMFGLSFIVIVGPRSRRIRKVGPKKRVYKARRRVMSETEKENADEEE